MSAKYSRPQTPEPLGDTAPSLFFVLTLSDSCTASLQQKDVFQPGFSSVRRGGGEEDTGKKRAGRERKPPQMKILNQHALPLQLRPRWGLHLIYSPKPGNQAIKRNQTLRFPALNGPTVLCGQLGIPVNSFEVAMKRCRPRPFRCADQFPAHRMLAWVPPLFPSVW